ncbi:CAMK family protein kinase [Tritrichomonas foetus]|uniref:CAMK family protein kinase n=1 Tax=Tritrichomonas foetus TaxID=1144522 RepID=A0A1J4JVU1_9EUKA|nr:CAMK family protein kinase [Tritrichomonas foetus]|eukprot:OHT01652.1 CAMK family protein kinase [Tritrichomonas foetus]
MTSIFINEETVLNIPERFGSYQFVKVLGRGSFSVVVQCKRISTSKSPNQEEFFACKILSQQYLIKENLVDSFQHEIMIFSKIKHTNIVRLIEMISDDKLIYIVMEYCSHGDLFHLIREHGKIDERNAAIICKQILDAIVYIHERNIVHRDLKPENILLDAQLNIKLADFGFSKELTNDNVLMKTQCGSPIYAAPELVSNENYDGKKVDMWSVGVIIFVMITGEIPWQDVENAQHLFYQIQTARYHIPSTVSEAARNLINGLMQPRPEIRFSASEAFSHPWVQAHPMMFEGQSQQCFLSSRMPSVTPVRPYNLMACQMNKGSFVRARKATETARERILMKHKMPITERKIVT